MMKLFQELNFIVCVHRNLTVTEMRDVFKQTVSMYADEAYCGGCNFTAFAACILTKGGERYKDFYGADNKTMEMQDFVELMLETPLLQLIPKLVIFHFYRGKRNSNILGKFVDNLFIAMNTSFKCDVYPICNNIKIRSY